MTDRDPPFDPNQIGQNDEDSDPHRDPNNIGTGWIVLTDIYLHRNVDYAASEVHWYLRVVRPWSRLFPPFSITYRFNIEEEPELNTLRTIITTILIGHRFPPQGWRFTGDNLDTFEEFLDGLEFHWRITFDIRDTPVVNQYPF